MTAALAASLRLAAPRRWAAAPLRRRCVASASADAPQTPPAAPHEAPAVKRAWRGRSALDFSALPPAAAAPDVLLLDGTYFACSVASSSQPLPEALAATVSRLVAVVQPRLTVAAFDSGLRKAAPRGSVDARRAARAAAAAGGASLPSPRRGDPRPLAAALAARGIPACVAPDDAQGDDVLASLAAASAGTPLRVLVASGDADVQSALRRRDAATGAGGCDWLRVAPHPSARHPAVLELVTWQSFFERYGFLPERYAVLGALLGRPRDAVPSCRGVGDRAAAALVRAYSDVDAMLQAAGALPDTEARWWHALARCFADTWRRAADGKLRSFRPEVAAALLAPGMAEQLRTSVGRCTPQLDAAQPIPEELAALIRQAAAVAPPAA